MNDYIDIILLPDPEFRAEVLMNSLYIKLHKTLCDLNSTSIGISFPEYRKTLGNCLRVHGQASVLDQLKTRNWIGGMTGYCQQREPRPAPTNAKFRVVSRLQPKMTQAKLNRLIKRGSITEGEITAYKTKMFTKGLNNPYLELQSGSNGHKHRRYITMGPLLDQPVEGEFDQFGLSKTATIPWF